MSTRRRYEYTAERDGPWWFIKVPELGRSTQTKRLDQADAMVRDLIATWLDVAPATFDVSLDSVRLDDDSMSAWVRALNMRDDAEVAAKRSAFAMRQTIGILTANGLSYRDVALLLGVSFQRVQQLAAAPETILSPQDQEASHRALMARLREELQDDTGSTEGITVADPSGIHFESNVVVGPHQRPRRKSPVR